MASNILTGLGLPAGIANQAVADGTVADDVASEEKQLTKDESKLKPSKDIGKFDSDLAGFLKSSGAKMKATTLNIGKGLSYKITSPKRGTTVLTKLPTSSESSPSGDINQSSTGDYTKLLGAGKVSKSTLKSM
jgi:hypothetical protein